ncbi:MAG: response regulator [Dehalococcoidales bacterium]|nr:response regulator [Dehalococcoidales bacterium]
MDLRDIHIKIPLELYTKLKVKCAYEGISMQEYITKLVNDNIEGRPGRKQSVLIVDDEKIMRDSLTDWLKDGYEVTAVESGEKALDMIKKQDFDVMVIDVKLTGKSGLQVLKEVKELKPHIKSIIITAYPSIDLAVKAMKAGAADYLVKPFSPDQLEKLM